MEKIVGCLFIVYIALVVSAFSGCSWTGTKSVDMWGLKWENFAGMDVHGGFNNVDNVHDQRGVGAVLQASKY